VFTDVIPVIGHILAGKTPTIHTGIHTDTVTLTGIPCVRRAADICCVPGYR